MMPLGGEVELHQWFLTLSGSLPSENLMIAMYPPWNQVYVHIDRPIAGMDFDHRFRLMNVLRLYLNRVKTPSNTVIL